MQAGPLNMRIWYSLHDLLAPGSPEAYPNVVNKCTPVLERQRVSFAGMSTTCHKLQCLQAVINFNVCTVL